LRTAGIQVVMVTGDHRNTAQAIAKELGLLDHGPDSATGSELDALNDEELRRRVSSIGVFARVTAEHKFRIVRAWQAGGAVVAMTGDGVNDAPALKQADVGIAMGLAGTDVTKEAADMVVTDDNIASIAAAVEEGRIIYANIQKAVSYLLSHNIGEIGVMLGAGLLALPLPLTAVQIRWINLVTDGLPALALALDPTEPDVMQQRPRARDARLFTRDRLALVIGRGVVMAAIGLAVFIAALYAADMSLESSRTVMFTVLVLTQLFQAPIWRSDRLTLAELGLFSNRPLIGAIAVSAALQIVILTAEPLHPIFQVADLTLGQWVAAVAIAFMPVPLWEWLKARRRSAQ